MKILIVHNFYQQPGGEDAVVRDELALLKAAGDEVRLFSVHNDSIRGFGERLTTACGLLYNFGAKRRLLKQLREFSPDVVHVHNFFPLLSPSIFDACREFGVPSVMTLHNFRTLCPTSFLYYDEQVRERSLNHSSWWTVSRRVYHNSYVGTFAVAAMVEWHKCFGTWRRKVDVFVALTQFARAKFIEGGLPAEKLVVKGNAAVDPGTLSANLDGGRRRGGLFVGRLSEEKGVRTLIEAWRDLDVPLRIVGDGPLADWVDANAGPSVTRLGRMNREEVQQEMQSAGFLVLPSIWYEMFPVVIPEAFAVGLPVVVSALSGLAEIVHDGETGYHFAVSNPQDLAAKVQWADDHPDDLIRMGVTARAYYEQEFTPQVNYERLMKIYVDAISTFSATHPGRR